MVDFKLNDEQRQFQQLARDFAAGEIAPLSAQLDAQRRLPLDIAKQAWQLGLMNTVVPENCGGLGLNTFDACLVTEELANGCSGIAACLESNNDVAMALVLAGNSEQKQRCLEDLTANFGLAASCIVEPGTGCNFQQLKTTATAAGDYYVLNGQKSHVIAAESAKWFVVWAVTDSSRGIDGLSAFLLPKGISGLHIGEAQSSLGQNACDRRIVSFSDIKLPADCLLGQPGQGWEIYQNVQIMASPRQSALSVGVARAALEHALRYAQQRFTFGQAIAAHQAVSFMLADMAKDIEAARLMTWQLARSIDNGRESRRQAMLARTFAADMCMRVAVDAVQVFGGYGYSREYPVEKLMRDAKAMQVGQALSQNQAADIGGELILAYGT